MRRGSSRRSSSSFWGAEPGRGSRTGRTASRWTAAPRSARAWNNLGSIELPRGHVEAAIDDLTRAVSLDPDLAVYRINLADALNAASRGREAAEQFEAAYRLEPDLPEAHRGLGEVALGRGDRVAAESEFRIAAGANEPSARAANFLG